jgi:hypothetical protein
MRRRRDLAGRIVEREGLIRDEWIADNRWVVVPIETAKHFDNVDCEALSRAAAACNYTTAFAVPTEPLKNCPAMLDVHLTPSDLAEFSSNCGSFAYALIELHGGFSVVCNHTCYFLVGGPRRFIELVVGDIGQAFVDFEEYIDSEMPEYQSWLRKISGRYRRGH